MRPRQVPAHGGEPTALHLGCSGWLYWTDLASESRRRRAIPASSLRAKPGTSSIRPPNSRWPSTTSSIGGLRGDRGVAGRLVEQGELAEGVAGAEGRDLAAVAADRRGAVDDHEELAAGGALADEDPAGIDLDVLGPPGDERQLLRERAEKSGTWARWSRKASRRDMAGNLNEPAGTGERPARRTRSFRGEYGPPDRSC